MKSLLLAAGLLVTASAAAQTTSTKLPPANPLPPPTSEEGQVMAPITVILRALETNDGAAVLAASRPEGGLTVALEGPNGRRGVRHKSWAEFAASLKPDGNRYEERIFDPAIEIDGDVAFVWARFAVLKNGAVEHCGYDLFDVVREDGAWKVLNITWSQRTTGCFTQ